MNIIPYIVYRNVPGSPSVVSISAKLPVVNNTDLLYNVMVKNVSSLRRMIHDESKFCFKNIFTAR